jgi:hypothetical protein
MTHIPQRVKIDQEGLGEGEPAMVALTLHQSWVDGRGPQENPSPRERLVTLAKINI